MTKKMEWVYREILFQVLERKQGFLSQSSISKRCGVSIGNVNKSLKPLESMNCIEKKPRGFRVLNPKKILLYWASIRNLQRDILYQTRTEKPVEEIEKEMPTMLFTAYSGFKFRFRRIPAEYSEILIYSKKEKIMERFPQKKGIPNIIVLKSDIHLKIFRQIPIGQLFADLWNLNTWYANDFIIDLEKRIDKIIKEAG
jgi:hypothetical protein